MEILSDDAIKQITSYLKSYKTKLDSEEEKANLINNLAKSTLEDRHLQDLFYSLTLEKRDFLTPVFPRTDIGSHQSYIDDHALEYGSPTSICLGLGTKGDPCSYENVQGNDYGFYLSSNKDQDTNLCIDHLPKRVKELFSGKYNHILLEPGEIAQTLRAMVSNKNFNPKLPNPTDIQTGLEKAIGESIDYITSPR